MAALKLCPQISLSLLWALFDICGLIGFEGKYFIPNSATKMNPCMIRGQPQSSALPPPLQLAALCTSARMFRIMKAGWMPPLHILIPTLGSRNLPSLASLRQGSFGFEDCVDDLCRCWALGSASVYRHTWSTTRDLRFTHHRQIESL